MRFIGLILIVALLVSGTAAAAHGFGETPPAKAHAMAMPCCPDHQKTEKAGAMNCHYCCVSGLALLSLPRMPLPPFRVAFPDPEESRMVLLTGDSHFRPPRSFI